MEVGDFHEGWYEKQHPAGGWCLHHFIIFYLPATCANLGEILDFAPLSCCGMPTDAEYPQGFPPTPELRTSRMDESTRKLSKKFQPQPWSETPTHPVRFIVMNIATKESSWWIGKKMLALSKVRLAKTPSRLVFDATSRNMLRYVI